MFKPTKHILLACVLSLFSSLSLAEIITFDNVQPNDVDEVFLNEGDTFSEDGFTILAGENNLFSIDLVNASSPAFNTGFNDEPSIDDSFSIFADDGSNFSINADFETTVLSTAFFESFLFVVTEIGEQGLFIDNITLARAQQPNPVSQPSVIALFALGLIVLGLRKTQPFRKS